MSSPLIKYLQRYAEPEATQLASLLSSFDRPGFDRQYDTALCIPAFDEEAYFLSRLSDIENISNVLVILAINQPDHKAESEKNHQLLTTIQTRFTLNRHHNNISLFRSAHHDLLVVDRFSEGDPIPEKSGVGLVRKIMGDIACALYQNNILRSPWVYSTDADATLPQKYFSAHNDVPSDISALVFDFQHQCDGSDIAQATHQYERAIKYYRDGLAWAQSPYAFYTLGSTLAYNIKYYAQVRGFPPRPGGEDFYFLNKVAKLGRIEFKKDMCISLEARLSDRVPFGTGPAVKDILTLESPSEYNYYNPKVFSFLKVWLSWVNQTLSEQTSDKWHWPSILATTLPEEVQTCVEDLGFNKFLQHANNQCTNKESFLKQFHAWFDAFKTLKFVRHLQTTYPDLPIDQCCGASQAWNA